MRAEAREEEILPRPVRLDTELRWEPEPDLGDFVLVGRTILPLGFAPGNSGTFGGGGVTLFSPMGTVY